MAITRWSQRRGITLKRTAEAVGLSRRTLSRWRRGWRVDRLASRPRGRPARHVDVVQRNEVIEVVRQLGDHVGVRVIAPQFPHLPRRQVAELVVGWKQAQIRLHRRGLEHLYWTTPGSVWALDHVEPLVPIDDQYPYLLGIRDLASRQQLAWLPVVDCTALTTVQILEPLFEAHGEPLVMKSDQGPGFMAEAFQDLLRLHGVKHLLSPPCTPTYNGAIESGDGSMKLRTAHQARLDGRWAWTSDDCEAARRLANATARPFGSAGPTPDQVWAARTRISSQDRAGFAAAVLHERQQLLDCLKLGPDAPPTARQGQWIDRKSVSRALVARGYLVRLRRPNTQQVNLEKEAKIM